jgi:hypothetical protein
MSCLGLVFPHRSEPSSVSGAGKNGLELNFTYLSAANLKVKT